MLNIFTTVIAGIPLYMFFAWHFFAARKSYYEGIKNKKYSPVPYLASYSIIYTSLSLILILLIQPKSIFLICFFATMLFLGLWHFYWWHKFKIFKNES